MSKNKTDFEKLKSPNQPTSYTSEQLTEFSKCLRDPLWFMENFMYIQSSDPTVGKTLFKPYPFQVEMINAYLNHRNVISMIPRQAGKTTITAGYLLWYAMFNEDVTVLIAANKFKAANEIMMRIKYAYEEMPNHIRAGVKEYNVTSIAFDNGSRIVATTTTPDSGRGMSISLLYCDEFAHLRGNVATHFWSSMSPTLSRGGKCIITSTPLSDEDLFAELWFGAINTIDDKGNDIPGGVGKNGFKAVSAHYSDVPERNEEWAANERAKIGDEKFEREFECKFAGEESTLISGVTLQRLGHGSDPVFKTHENVRWYDKVTANRVYLVALDPAGGVGGDDASIAVWSLPDMCQIAEWNHNRTSIPNQVRIMQLIVNYIHDQVKQQNSKIEPEIYYTLEHNTIGYAALQTVSDIGEENFMGQFLHEPKRFGLVRNRKGLNTNGRTKAAACAKFKSLLERNKLQIKSKVLIRQLKFFVSKGDGFEAKINEKDDCVMSTLLCIRLMQMVTSWDEVIGEIMRDEFDDSESEPYREPLPFSIMIN